MSLRDVYAGALAGILLLLLMGGLIPPTIGMPSWAESILCIAVFLGTVWAGVKGVFTRAWRIVARGRLAGDPAPVSIPIGERAIWEMARDHLARLQSHFTQLSKFPAEIAKAALRVPALQGVLIATS
jgi:hypothetical protein